MKFNIRRSHSAVTALVLGSSGIVRGMADIFDLCEQWHPATDWQPVRRLAYEEDVLRLSDWLRDVLTNEPPDPTIGAYWFGLFEPIVDGLPKCGLYVAGAEAYDPDVPDADAFCGPSYWPERRYAHSDVLNELYRFGSRQSDGARAEAHYALCLAYSGLAVCSIIERVGPELLLGGRSTRSVAYGFDSGDCNPLGWIEKDSLRRVAKN